MGRIVLKIVAVLVILGALGIIGYAYFGDMTPVQTEQRQEVTLPGAATGAN